MSAGPVADQPVRPRTPPGVGKEAVRPVSVLCSRKAAHGTKRTCTLREVLLHARTFGLIQAAHGKEERGSLEEH